MTELYNTDRYDRLHHALTKNYVRISHFGLSKQPSESQPFLQTLNGCPSLFSEATTWGRNPNSQDARNCERTFRLRANMETKVEVKMPSQGEGLSSPSTVWAYAPYMDALPGSWGPMVRTAL